MLIEYDSIALASETLAEGRVGPRGYSLNGRQIVDELEFFQAATATLFGRGGRSVAAGFEVQRFFGTEALAVEFAHIHHNALPDEGDLDVTQGATVLRLADAVLEAVDVVELRGLCVTVRYSFRGSAWALVP
jgi:hypothetical protein